MAYLTHDTGDHKQKAQRSPDWLSTGVHGQMRCEHGKFNVRLTEEKLGAQCWYWCVKTVINSDKKKPRLPGVGTTEGKWRASLQPEQFNDVRTCLRGHEFPVTGPAAVEAGTRFGSYVSFVSVAKIKHPCKSNYMNKEFIRLTIPGDSSSLRGEVSGTRSSHLYNMRLKAESVESTHQCLLVLSLYRSGSPS